MRPLLMDMTRDELGALLEGLPKYRLDQLYSFVIQGSEYNDMTSLPKSLLSTLSEEYDATGVSILEVRTAPDGTEKYLFTLRDGNIIEGVLMTYKYGRTICVSTQVGCRMNCAFCASGIDGRVRDLTAGEILGQITEVNRRHGGGVKDKRFITNVVLMGSGEPLDNYDNVVKFLGLVRDGIGISLRNISLSTSGLVPNIYRLADEIGGVTLTISLHAPLDEIRDKIMPVNKAYPIADLIKATKYYAQKTGRRVIFEYVMLKGVNDTRECAIALAGLLKGLPAHVNLINLNYVEEKKLLPCSKKQTYEFMALLEKLGVSVTVRRSLGSEVAGACGQLRRSVLRGETDE